MAGCFIFINRENIPSTEYEIIKIRDRKDILDFGITTFALLTEADIS